MSDDQEYLIALGSNLPSDVGPQPDTLRAALRRLAELGVQILDTSLLYQTPCFPAGAGPDYVNAAAKVRFDGKPCALLEVLHRVEAEFGRSRAQRWGQRTLDLDLLAAADLVWPNAETHARWRDLPLEDQMRDSLGEMVLPHPRMQDRAFVLVPLNDVASDWRHPTLHKSVSEMLAALPDASVAEVHAL